MGFIFSSVLEFISHFRICSILHTKPQYVQKTLDATKGLDHPSHILFDDLLDYIDLISQIDLLRSFRCY